MKFINNKLFYFDSYGIPFIPDIIKNQYDKIITNIFRIQSDISVMNAENFLFYSLKQIFKTNLDYIKFLLQFHKNDFEKNDI